MGKHRPKDYDKGDGQAHEVSCNGGLGYYHYFKAERNDQNLSRSDRVGRGYYSYIKMMLHKLMR